MRIKELHQRVFITWEIMSSGRKGDAVTLSRMDTAPAVIPIYKNSPFEKEIV